MINVLLLRELSPFYLSGCRFTIAGIMLSLIYFLFIKEKERLSRRQLLNSILIGVLFLTIGNGAMAWSLQYLDSGYAALIISTQPLIVLLLNQFLFGQKTKLNSYIGVFISIIGLIILMSNKESTDSTHLLWGTAAIAISLLVWGWGTIYIGRDQFPKSYILNTSIQMMIGGPLLLLMSYFVEDTKSLMDLSNNGWLYFSYLVVLGSICTFTAFNYLLINVSAEKVVTNTYVNPVVAVLLGVFILDETISLSTILGGLLMLAGVYAILNVKYSKLTS